MSEQEKQEQAVEPVDKAAEIAAEELDEVSGGTTQSNTYRGVTTINDGIVNISRGGQESTF